MILTFKEKDFAQGEVKDGPRAGETWTRYDYWWRERKEKTSIFDNESNAEKIAFLEELQPGQKADVTLESKKSGRFTNYTILDVRTVDGAPQTTAPLQQATPENLAAYQRDQGVVAYQADGSEVSQDIWEAKDRRIAMESAYSSAARFLAGLDREKEDLINLARFIYADIQRAGKGETLGPVKAAPRAS